MNPWDIGYDAFHSGQNINPYTAGTQEWLDWEDGFFQAELDERNADEAEYDGQPDWAKEWEDFGEVYDDSYPLYDGDEY